MKKIGLIGGTFNPIHYGHLILAEQARIGEGLSEVIFMPAKSSPYKMHCECAGEWHRYSMVSLAIESNPFFSVSDLEINGPEVSYTIDTLRSCKELLGEGSKLYFICGTDAFLGMEGWKNIDGIFMNFPLIVGSRPRYKDRARDEMIRRVREKYGAEVHKVHMPKIDISSSEIKNRIRDGKSIRYLLPENVSDYIETNKLYRNL